LRSTVALIAVLLAAGCASGPRAPVVERTASRPAAAPPAPRAAAPARPPVAAPAAPPAAEGYYVVKRGDTLYSIALENGADYRELAQWNGLDDPARIQVGQALRVKPPENRAVQIGTPTIVGRIESRPLDAGTADARGTPAETPKLQPKPATAEAKPQVAAAPAAAGPVEFIWPVKGKVIAGFSEPRSKGIDIDGKLGEPVVAAAPGRVTYIGSGIPGLGKLVVIKHDNGFITVYAHNRDIVVKEQQSVARGQKIAELGASDSDRPKLHFQIRKGAAAVDPLRYLPAL
jgi:lipoprotein NlpD